MHGTSLSGTWGRLVRCAVALAGVVTLAGCTTGYAYVQPNVAGSGGYYTGDDAYTGQGYYDYYGTGPYYPGIDGWGYYNGTGPYAGAFGWGGGYYGYGSPFFFNLGISNVWGFPGYWGPWYSLDFPIWGCWDGCWYHHRHRHWRHDGWHGRGDHGRHDSVVANLSPPPGVRPEHMPVSPHTHRGPVRLLPDLADRHPLESASFAPHGFVRAPVRRAIAVPRFNDVRGEATWTPRMPETPAFARGRIAPLPAARTMPHGFSAPRPVFGSAPVPRPSSPSSRAPKTRIP